VISQSASPAGQGTVNPGLYAGALVLFGLVIFSVPEGAVFPLTFIMVFSTLLIASKDANNRGVRNPLQELGFE